MLNPFFCMKKLQNKENPKNASIFPKIRCCLKLDKDATPDWCCLKLNKGATPDWCCLKLNKNLILSRIWTKNLLNF